MFNRFCGYGCYSNSSHNGITRVKLSKIQDILGGRSNNREVLGVNRRLLDDSEARVNLRVTFILLLLLLFRNIVGRGRLILIDNVTINVFVFTGSYSLFARL